MHTQYFDDTVGIDESKLCRSKLIICSIESRQLVPSSDQILESFLRIIFRLYPFQGSNVLLTIAVQRVLLQTRTIDKTI
jgi:hypothetical protein